jgi:AP-3 complex subunit mu
MLHTFFIMNSQGEILMEKHWRGTIPRHIGEEFWAIASKETDVSSLLPVISFNKYYFVHIFRGGMFFLAVQHGEANPLMTLELLCRLADLFKLYLDGLSEELLKDNFVVIYQLLDEVIDNGFPVQTEPTVLKDLIEVPSLFKRLGVTPSVSTTAKSLENSPVPWRKTNIKYANNEIFFDIVEELDSIIDVNGNIVSCDVFGRIECNCRLSGMPDVLVSFLNHQALDDVCFHPCVRYARYEQDRSLSFIPPDGTFDLMRYRHNYSSHAPFYVTPKVTLQEDNGRINIIVGLRSGGKDVPEKGVTDVVCSLQLPDNAECVKLEPSQGSYHFDLVTKKLRWDVGKISKERVPTVNGSVTPAGGTKFPEGSTPSVLADFKMQGATLTGLKIETVSIVNERYKPFKGMKSSVTAGTYEIRTS